MYTSIVKLAVALACVVGLAVYSVDKVPDLNNLRRQLITSEDPLRIAVFGSSQSWGANLEDRFMAYPFRLSPRVDNFAYFASGPNYPAVCLQSIIGDHAVYDLILLEYYVSGAEHGLAELARRLRERFPEAIIIVMKFYMPIDALRADAGSSDYKSLRQWKESLTLPNDQLNEFIEAIDNDNGVWKFKEHPNADRAINRAVREIGGYQFRLPSAGSAQNTLVTYLRWFDKEKHQHLEDRAHAWVADMCDAIVKKHILAINRTTQQVRKGKSAGTWGGGDSCDIWLTTGGMPHSYSESISLTQYDVVNGKFAMEVPLEGGWIEISNNMPTSRVLFLSFISSGQADLYPDCTAEIMGQEYLLDTNAGKADIHKAGMVRTVPTATIPAGSTVRVKLTPTAATEHEPFRLVGTTFTNGDIDPVEFGFGPNFNV